MMARIYPWLMLFAAMALFAVHFVPQLFFKLMDTETITLALLYEDIVTLRHPASDWQWGAFSGLFPDVTVFFILNYLSNSGWFSLQGTMVFFFVAWAAGLVGLVAAIRRPHSLILIAVLFLLLVSVACDFGIDRYQLQDAFFQPIYHSGTGVLCLSSVALLFHQILRVSRAGFCALSLLVFLGGVSDVLYLVVFVIPALATLASIILIFPDKGKRHIFLTGSLLVAGSAAYFFAPHGFPVPLNTGSYTALNLNATPACLSTMWTELKSPDNWLFTLLVGMDALFVVVAIVIVGFCFSARGRKGISPFLLCVMIYGTSAIVCDYASVMLIGRYGGMGENRYLIVALIIPTVVLIFTLHSLIRWPFWLESVVAIAAACTIGACAFRTERPSDVYQVTVADAAFMKAYMKENHITDGLADYWRANLFCFVSDGAVNLRMVGSDGEIFHYYDTLWWYGKGRPLHQAPRFRLIYSPDARAMGAKFGQPDHVLTTPSGSTIWVYSAERSIRYNDFFHMLSNGLTNDGHTLCFSATGLSGATGSVHGSSRVASEGKDAEGYVTFGPFIALEPGNYQVVYHYAYLARPKAGSEATFDIKSHGKNEAVSGLAALPFVDKEPKVFAENLLVSRADENYEMRVYFHGSGSVRVDSLEVTCLQP